MSLASAVVLLQTALSLLTLVNTNPSLPQAMRDNAQQVAQQAITQATAAIAASKTDTASSAQSAPFTTAANSLPVASYDLKPQAYTIMNTAIDNYRKLISFGQECINLAKSRQVTMQNLSSDRDSWLAKLSFDPLLLKQQTLLYDLYANDESAMIDYQGKCQHVIDVLNNAIDQINTDIMSLQKSNQPVSGDVLASYQERYLSNNGFESPRAAIQNVIDRIDSMIIKDNKTFADSYAAIQQYVKNSTIPASIPLQYIPAMQSLPVAPQTARCTITGDGGVGLQTYVNCTSY